MFHPLCHLGHQLGNVDARHGSRDGAERPAGLDARLGVECLELTGAAGQPEQDAAFLLLLHLGGDGRFAQHAQPGEASGAGRDSAEEAATIDGMLGRATEVVASNGHDLPPRPGERGV